MPQVVQMMAANVNETTQFAQMIDALPTLAKKRGCPRWKPEKVHADKGYDSQSNRDHLKKRGIKSRIARRGIESKEKLGRYCWVIERTIAWLHSFRRLRISYQRRDDIHQAFLLIGCALLCFNALAK